MSFPISRELHRRLNTLAQSNRASLFMVFQSAMAALFTKLGAGTDIPIGSPVSGRNDDSLDQLIGFFINTLVFRVDTSDDPSFDELLRRVREEPGGFRASGCAVRAACRDIESAAFQV